MMMNAHTGGFGWSAEPHYVVQTGSNPDSTCQYIILIQLTLIALLIKLRQESNMSRIRHYDRSCLLFSSSSSLLLSELFWPTSFAVLDAEDKYLPSYHHIYYLPPYLYNNNID